MKTNINSIISKISFTVMLLILIMSLSCVKSEQENLNADSITQVSISIKGIEYDNVLDIGNKASNSLLNDDNYFQNNKVPNERKTIELNDKFLLNIELSPDLSSNSKIYNKLATTNDLLKQDIKYKLAIFDDNGAYVTEQDYTYGTEQSPSTPQINLSSGIRYTFIVYSINSTTDLPGISFQNVNNKTLETSNVNILAGQDFMYFKKEMMLEARKTNYIGVILKHKLSQITTTIDASRTGYNITSISSYFSPSMSSAVVKLSDANITRNQTNVNATVNFPNINQQIVISNPCIINHAENTATQYRITSLKIGEITVNNLTPLSDLTIIPGVKYNLKLNIVPTDTIFEYMGFPVARINGTIWMRHNLGADYSLDPDQNPSVAGLHGNYYQFGIKTPSASATDITQTNFSNTHVPAYDDWLVNNNSDNPMKHANDPCPNGFRIPISQELYNLLLKETILDEEGVGQVENDPTNYSYGHVIISKRKSNVKMTFPAQGSFDLAPGGPPYTPRNVQFRGAKVLLVASSTSHPNLNSPNAELNVYINHSNSWSFELQIVPSSYYKAYSIRCVAE